MSVRKQSFYNWKCDGCGVLCDLDMWHLNEKTLQFVAEKQGWITDGDNHYCPKCYEYDDNDNLVVKGGEE